MCYILFRYSNSVIPWSLSGWAMQSWHTTCSPLTVPWYADSLRYRYKYKSTRTAGGIGQARKRLACRVGMVGSGDCVCEACELLTRFEGQLLSRLPPRKPRRPRKKRRKLVVNPHFCLYFVAVFQRRNPCSSHTLTKKPVTTCTQHADGSLLIACVVHRCPYRGRLTPGLLLAGSRESELVRTKLQRTKGGYYSR